MCQTDETISFISLTSLAVCGTAPGRRSCSHTANGATSATYSNTWTWLAPAVGASTSDTAVSCGLLAVRFFCHIAYLTKKTWFTMHTKLSAAQSLAAATAAADTDHSAAATSASSVAQQAM